MSEADQSDQDGQLLAAMMNADPHGTRRLIFADPDELTELDRQLQRRLWALAPNQWAW